MALLLAALAFMAAFLSFSIEPLVGRFLLPVYGGTPAVWTTSVVFFQIALLAGYAWAYLGPRMLGARRASVVQIVFVTLPVLTLPVAQPVAATGPDAVPTALWLLRVLVPMVGLPFAALSSIGPTAARWLAASRSGGAYRLLAASNAGSLLGLLAYPLLVEPNFDLDAQAAWWTVGYAGVVVMTGVAAVAAFRTDRRPIEVDAAGAGPGAGPEVVQITHPIATGATGFRLGAGGTTRQAIRTTDRAPGVETARWVALAAVPSSLVLGVTAHLTTDVAAVPLLWVVPLAVYLLTLILSFVGERPIGLAWAERLLPIAAVGVVAVLLDPARTDLRVVFAVDLSVLFLAGLVCHGRAAELRPPAARLTAFTLGIAAGGAAGGLLTAVLAPLVLPGPLEYPIAVVLALLARRAGSPVAGLERVPFAARYAVAAVVIVLIARAAGLLLTTGGLVGVLALGVLVVLAPRPRLFAGAVATAVAVSLALAPPSLFSTRTFFGTYRVEADQAGRHALYSGTTIHGTQQFANTDGRREPIGYYYRAGPVGDVLGTLDARAGGLSIGVVGLGAGGLAAYGRPQDRFDFFEIDPAVEQIARDPQLFTYLRDTPSQLRVVLGDGRLSLGDVPPASYDLLVLDAFSSDAVPVHLLTREALELDVTRLRPHGLLLVNVSNSYVDLARAVAAVGRDLGLVGIVRDDDPSPETRPDAGAASWIVLGRSADDLQSVATDAGWSPLGSAPGTRAWTDRFSDLVPYLLVAGG